MSNPLAFPMYAINRADTDALWRAVQHLLAERGVPVSEGVPDDSLLAHWQQPADDAIAGRTGRGLFSLPGAGLRSVLLP